MGNMNEEIAREVRERYAAGGVTQVQLAEEYDVTRPTIYHALAGHSWTKAGGPINEHEGGPPNAVLTPEKVKSARERYAQGGISQTALAEENGVSYVAMHAALLGRSWENAGGPIHEPDSGHLDEKTVRAIRREAKKHPERSFADISRRRGLSRGTVSSILNGRTWSDLAYRAGELRPEEVTDRNKAQRKRAARASGKLTEEQVKAIRIAHAAGASVRELSKQYDCSLRAVYSLLRGDTWQHVGGPTVEKQKYRRITMADAREIRERAKTESFNAIATDTGVSISHVSRIVYNEVWYDESYKPPERIGRSG